MSRKEVLNILGPAGEKMSYETSRREMWRYRDRELFFREGRLSLPAAAAPAVVPVAGSASAAETPARKKTARTGVVEPYDARRTAAIFNEIMKEIPSEPEAGAGAVVDGRTPPMVRQFGAGPREED